MRAGVLAAAALMAIATPCEAAWQWTTWNMTPAQVIAASKGAATSAHGDPDDRVYDADLRAVGTYSAGGFDFDAQFYFDRAEHLKVVRLTLTDADKCEELRSAISSLYGEPSATLTYQTRWSDAAHDNLVGYTQPFPDIGQSCFLTYRPLSASGGNGL